MHFIFLGPGEAGPWDVWLFWTQLGLAFAAVGSPFIAHILANRREARASHDADQRLEKANDQAVDREETSHRNAIAREELSHKRAEIRAQRERIKYSQIIFHGIKAEAIGIEGQVTTIEELWKVTKRATKFRDEELKVSVTPILSDPSIWSQLVGRSQLDALIKLLVRIQGHNDVIRIIWAQNDIINEPVREVIDKSIKQLHEALDNVFEVSSFENEEDLL